jgi:hypothetical protein
VPTRAVFVSALLTLLGYMGRTGSPGEVMNYMNNALYYLLPC